MKIKNKLFLLSIFLLFTRSILIIKYKTYIHPHLWEYEEITNNLISGKGFLYRHMGGAPYWSFNNPLYSFLCAGIYSVTRHNYLAVLLVQALFSIFLMLTIFYIGKILFSERTGLWSAIIVVFHPAFIYYDVFNLLPSSIDAFFIACSTLLFLLFLAKPNTLLILLTGISIALGTLSRGIIGALLPALAAYIILFLNNLKLKTKLKIIILLFISMFLVISPWLLRNYRIYKEFIFITSFTAEGFWRVNNKYATGTSLSKDGVPIFNLFPEDFRNKVYSLDEIGQKEFFEKEALVFIKNNPWLSVKFYFKRLYYFWWFSPQSGILYPKIFLVAYRCLYSILLFFSVLGLIFAFRSKIKALKDNAWLIIFVFMAICLSQSLFYTEGRHRWLIEPLLIIFFVYGISQVYNTLKIILNKRLFYLEFRKGRVNNENN